MFHAGSGMLCLTGPEIWGVPQITAGEAGR